jgi:hypothetical protein
MNGKVFFELFYKDSEVVTHFDFGQICRKVDIFIGLQKYHRNFKLLSFVSLDIVDFVDSLRNQIFVFQIIQQIVSASIRHYRLTMIDLLQLIHNDAVVLVKTVLKGYFVPDIKKVNFLLDVSLFKIKIQLI